MGDSGHPIIGGRSLHAWLQESAYVRAHDDERCGPRRKKTGRRLAPNSQSSEAAEGASSAQFELRGQSAPGKRKARRWMNDRLLRELAGPLDAVDIGALYAPPPWGMKTEMTVLERVTGVYVGGHGGVDPEAAAAWEPFRNNVDMDLQEQALRESHRRAAGQERAAMASWHMVERRARDALRRSAGWPLVQQLEEELLEFQGGEELELLLPIEVPYHRLLLHGLCQFHGLIAQTVEAVVPENTGSPVTCVNVQQRQQGRVVHRHIRLADVLNVGSL